MSGRNVARALVWWGLTVWCGAAAGAAAWFLYAVAGPWLRGER